MKNVIDFEDYKIKKKLSMFKGTWDLSYIEGIEQHMGRDTRSLISHVKDVNRLTCCVETFSKFNKDKKQLENNLSCGRHMYKYPTVVSKYRKSVDTFSGIYMFLQEALFKYENANDQHVWVIELFQDADFVNNIAFKIITDICLIEEFCEEYKHESYNSIQKTLKELIDQRNLYYHYLDIFISIRDIDFD